MKINTALVLKWGFVSLFIVATFLYVFKGINTELHFLKQQPPFLANYHFFSLYSSYPGGIIDYVSTFLCQFFSFGWVGSLIITVVAFVLITLFYNITKSFSRFSGNLMIMTIPIILMIALFNDYDFPFPVIIQFLTGNLFVFLFLHFYKRYSYPVIIYLAASILLYYLAGSGMFIIFSLSTLIIVFHKNSFKKGIVGAIPILLFSFIFPFLMYKYVFNISFENTYFQIISENQTYLQYNPFFLLYLFYGSTPIILLFLVLSEKVSLKKTSVDPIISVEQPIVPQFKKSKKEEAMKVPSSKSNKFFERHEFILSLQFIFLIILSVFLINLTLDKHKKNIVMADYYCYTEQWVKATKVILHDKEYDLLLNLHYNRAIRGAGSFTELFFNYPQYAGVDALFPDKQLAFELMMPSSDYYFDLGYIAEARHYAYEIQTFQPYNIRVLKRLVICNIISGNYKEADKFLSILQDNFLSHDFVQKYKAYMNDTLLIANDQLISEKRRFMPTNTVIPNDIESKITDLTQKNFLNKAAFEHLAMFYLLGQKFKKFMYLLPNLNVFYKELPSVFEEAIIVYSNNKKENILQFKLSPSAEKDFATMLQIINQAGNKNMAQSQLKDYSTKYLYYLLYTSPIVTNAKLKSKQELENAYREN
jgi:hypothetical protein